jgi:hypothetical protein
MGGLVGARRQPAAAVGRAASAGCGRARRRKPRRDGARQRPSGRSRDSRSPPAPAPCARRPAARPALVRVRAATHLREGVTAASATRGLAIMAPTPLITPAVRAAAARSCGFWALRAGEAGPQGAGAGGSGAGWAVALPRRRARGRCGRTAPEARGRCCRSGAGRARSAAGTRGTRPPAAPFGPPRAPGRGVDLPGATPGPAGALGRARADPSATLNRVRPARAARGRWMPAAAGVRLQFLTWRARRGGGGPPRRGARLRSRGRGRRAAREPGGIGGCPWGRQGPQIAAPTPAGAPAARDLHSLRDTATARVCIFRAILAGRAGWWQREGAGAKRAESAGVRGGAGLGQATEAGRAMDSGPRGGAPWRPPAARMAAGGGRGGTGVGGPGCRGAWEPWRARRRRAGRGHPGRARLHAGAASAPRCSTWEAVPCVRRGPCHPCGGPRRWRRAPCVGCQVARQPWAWRCPSQGPLRQRRSCGAAIALPPMAVRARAMD